MANTQEISLGLLATSEPSSSNAILQETKIIEAKIISHQTNTRLHVKVIIVKKNMWTNMKPKKNVLANISIDSAIDCAKRKLFAENNENNSDKTSLMSWWEIRGHQITTGLCYICTYKLTAVPKW